MVCSCSSDSRSADTVVCPPDVGIVVLIARVCVAFVIFLFCFMFGSNLLVERVSCSRERPKTDFVLGN